jgi:hypothetical protein
MDPFTPYQPRPKIVIPKLSAEDAETIALKAVAYIAADASLMRRFTALTGCGDAEEMRRRLAERTFLGSILDFILGHEQTTIAFARSISMAPEVAMMARSKLP